DPSFACTHSPNVLPSNNTIASDGGSAFARPGVITGGTGSHTSVSAGFGVVLDTGFCADVACATTRAMTSINALPNRGRMRTVERDIAESCDDRVVSQAARAKATPV